MCPGHELPKKLTYLSPLLATLREMIGQLKLSSRESIKSKWRITKITRYNSTLIFRDVDSQSYFLIFFHPLPPRVSAALTWLSCLVWPPLFCQSLPPLAQTPLRPLGGFVSSSIYSHGLLCTFPVVLTAALQWRRTREKYFENDNSHCFCSSKNSGVY